VHSHDWAEAVAQEKIDAANAADSPNVRSTLAFIAVSPSIRQSKQSRSAPDGARLRTIRHPAIDAVNKGVVRHAPG
jgi:hypothetical protein